MLLKTALYEPVSVLYREPKLLKADLSWRAEASKDVSVLYREPKLLKAIYAMMLATAAIASFSALP